MSAISIYFNTPNGHSLEFIGILEGEGRPELGVISYEKWIQNNEGKSISLRKKNQSNCYAYYYNFSAAATTLCRIPLVKHQQTYRENDQSFFDLGLSRMVSNDFGVV